MMHTEQVGGNQSGMALVLTLLTISFLVAITMQLMITIDRQLSVSAAQREQVRLDGMVLAGLNLARAALAADQRENTHESPHDLWATLHPDRLKALSGEVVLKVEVSELGGRLQVNALADETMKAYREIWLRFLLSGRFAVDDQDEAEDLLDAMADWIDEDDDERHGGAEEPYYQSLTPPYSNRNAPFSSLEELLLVKGMTPELLFGDAEHEGLADYITVMGNNGAVNLNTAPLPVIEALSSEMSAKLAQELIDFRQDPRHADLLSESGWYRQVTGFPASIELSNDLLVTDGQYFEVRSTAVLNQFSRTGTGIVLRGDEQRQHLLRWKQE
jgi:general secretion pathway protein K